MTPRLGFAINVMYVAGDAGQIMECTADYASKLLQKLKSALVGFGVLFIH